MNKLSESDEIHNWGDEIMALSHQNLEDGVHEQIADAIDRRIAALEARLSEMEEELRILQGSHDTWMHQYEKAQKHILKLESRIGFAAEALAGESDE
jgi:chromosome segregation ATPase